MDNCTFFRALVAAALPAAIAEESGGIAREIATRAVQIARATLRAELESGEPAATLEAIADYQRRRAAGESIED